MYQIGDKINIKFKEEKKETSIEQTFNDILSALNSSKLSQSEKLKWCQSMMTILESWFNEDELKSVKTAKNRLIPVLHKLVEGSSLENMALFFNFYKQTYAFCARRDFECFVDYMEWNSSKKVLSTRRNILKPYVDALNRIPFDDKLQYIVVSYAPSMGKSYISTLFTAWGMGISSSNSVIRMSYSEELVMGFSRTVKGYVSSPEFSEIFTDYKIYNGKPFEVERESDWKIKNASVPKSNHIARTRKGSTTGERASFAIIFDDMTKGAEEANSEQIHKDIYDKWLTEWWNRRDGERCKFIFVGTQWSPEDILNRIIEDREKISPLLETDNPFVMETEDHSTIVIRVPMLDDEHNTTCPEVYPQEIAEQIENNTDPFLFSCVYQQKPIAPTGREFAWECIKQWEDLPLNLTKNSMATLDPARKGKDFVSMPIFQNDNNGNHYLIDCIYKQKPMDDLYDEIVEKIIEHTITTLVIENNIDTSLKAIIEMKLHARGVFWCDIREKYNCAKKEERIKNYRGIVQKQIYFPSKTLVRPNTDMGKLMDNITKYSFDKPNLHDDGIDSVCMYASEIIFCKSMLQKPKPMRRIF